MVYGMEVHARNSVIHNNNYYYHISGPIPICNAPLADQQISSFHYYDSLRFLIYEFINGDQFEVVKR